MVRALTESFDGHNVVPRAYGTAYSLLSRRWWERGDGQTNVDLKASLL